MKKNFIKNSLVVGLMIMGLASFAPAVVAQPNARAQQAQENATERKEAVKLKLEAKKLEICEKREKNIRNIMARISDRGQKQLDVFNKIAERTMNFSVEKNKKPVNYDALVAEVDAKRTAAQTLVDDIKEESTVFECDADDPKGKANNFKELLKSEITALKEYKTAVKNLIVGVKSANGVENSNRDSTDDNGNVDDSTETDDSGNDSPSDALDDNGGTQ
ncbi:MAG: hypothetical protein M3Q70_03505 [bacterium]|nr:hypothetical protein [bacterium]